MSSSRARGHLRQLVRMRWLAACIGAALLYSAHTALDIEIPAVPVLGVLALYALLNAATAHFNVPLAIQVRDRGPGIAPALRKRIGKEPVTSRHTKKGRGR